MTASDSFTLLKISITDTWTSSRSPMPALLQHQNVPFEIWASTYDTARKHQSEYAATVNRRKFSAFIFFFAAMTFCPLLVQLSPGSAIFSGCLFIFLLILVRGIWNLKRQETLGLLLKWHRNVQTVKATYNTYGLNVSLVSIKRGTGKSIIIGGLKFTKIQATSKQPAVLTGAADLIKGGTEQTAATASHTGAMVQQLERLSFLWERGSLTDEEYKQAKSRILQDYTLDGTNNHGLDQCMPMAHAELVDIDDAAGATYHGREDLRNYMDAGEGARLIELA